MTSVRYGDELGLENIVIQISFANERPFYSKGIEVIDDKPKTAFQYENISSSTSGLTLGLCVSFSILLLLLVYIYYKRLRVKRNTPVTGSQAQLSLDNDATIDFGDYEGLYIPAFILSVPNEDFIFGKRVAKGGGGEIFLGTLVNPELITRNRHDNTCVIKTILDNVHVDMAAFLQEVSIMWLFRNEKSFAKLLAYSEKPRLIVMKWYSHGSLEDFIYGKNTELSKIPYIISIAIDLGKKLAIAVNTMHEKGFSHNDLKPGNILLEIIEKDLNIVLTDFGISTVLQSRADIVSTFNVKRVMGASIAYGAPEVLKCLESNTELVEGELIQCDIYSFGVIFYEIFGRRKPWANTSSRDIVRFVSVGQRPELTFIYKLGMEATNASKLETLIRLCWNHVPSRRPKLRSVIDLLSEFQGKGMGESKP